MRKSELYKDFRIAVKFVNVGRVPYPWYFGGTRRDDGSIRPLTLPFGVVEEDLGPCRNDFHYALAAGADLQDADTDQSTSRAYRVNVHVDGESATPVRCVCVTHETGLEVFLIAAGSFVGLEAAKFSLKRVLEFVERRINEWWMKRWKAPGVSRLEPSENEPIVQRIAFRTPHWELNIDGRFSDSERQQLLDYLTANLVPIAASQDYFAALVDQGLQRRAINATQRVVVYEGD